MKLLLCKFLFFHVEQVAGVDLGSIYWFGWFRRVFQSKPNDDYCHWFDKVFHIGLSLFFFYLIKRIQFLNSICVTVAIGTRLFQARSLKNWMFQQELFSIIQQREPMIESRRFGIKFTPIAKDKRIVQHTNSGLEKNEKQWLRSECDLFGQLRYNRGDVYKTQSYIFSLIVQHTESGLGKELKQWFCMKRSILDNVGTAEETSPKIRAMFLVWLYSIQKAGLGRK